VSVRAFSDESERSGVMLLAVVLLEPGEVDGARRNMRQLLLPGQRRVHAA
jgi:Flp pilus assembly protein TadD